MDYKVEIISKKKKDKLLAKLYPSCPYEVKAEIYGLCIKLFTNSHGFKDMWEENFKSMLETIRPHARLVAVDEGGKFKVMYEPASKTVIIQNCDYYGWVKSIALALAADYMEDFQSEHKRYSIHGSYIDSDGRGIGVIGPSKSGKTTLTYGLLLDEKNNFLTDDWFFVRIGKTSVLASSAEKNSYIRDDLAKNWKAYGRVVAEAKLDNKGRAIVDVKNIFGYDRIKSQSTMKAIVLLTRDKTLSPIKKMKTNEAITFMKEHEFCNPHQLVRTKEKMQERTEFFKKLFEKLPVYLLNTIETPQRSLERLKEIMDEEVNDSNHER
ncbi:MAG: hypothetical protein ABII22_06805 [Candidatus Micrarchaeota archaeon]